MAIFTLGAKRTFEQRQAAFVEIARELAAEDDLDRLLRLIGERVCRLLRSDSACLCLVEGDELVYCASHGIPEEAWRAAPRRRIAESRVGRVIVTPRVYATEDATQDAHWRDSEIVTRWGYRAILEVPVILRGEVIGALAALDKAPRSFSPEEVTLLIALADHMAVALDRTRLLRETQARLRETQTLLAVGQAVSATLDLTEALRRVARETCLALGADMVGAFLADPGHKFLHPVAGYHVPKRVLKTFVEFPIPLEGHRILEEAWEHRRPVWSSDVAADPRIDRESFERFPHRSNLFFPLVVKGGPIGGLFVIWWEQAHEFTPEELKLVEGISRQAALAVDNARLYEEAERRRREAEVLAELASSVTASLDLETVLQRIAEGAKELCGSDLAKIGLREPGSDGVVCRNWVGARYNTPVGVESGKGIGGQVLATGRPFRTDGYAEDPRFSKDYLEVVARERVVTALAVPIRIADRVEGVLYVCNCTIRPFTDRDEEILGRLAAHAAIVIQNARLYEAAERHRRAAERLAEVGRLVSQSLDPKRVGQQIVESVRLLAHGLASALWRLEPETGDMVALAFSGDPGPTSDWTAVFRRGIGAVGLAVSERRPVFTPNVLKDPRITLTPEARARIESAPHRAVLAVPLLVQDQVIGALSVVDQAGREFDAEDIQLAEAFAHQAAVALNNAQLYEEVKGTRDFLQSIAQNSADAIVTTDVHGRLTYFSPGAGEIFGYRAEELLGRPVADYYRGGREEARAVMRRLRAEGRIRNYEAAFLARDGRWVEASSSLSLLRDLRGGIIRTLAVVRDNTERKRAEEALRKSEAECRMIFERSAIGIAFGDIQDRVLGANPALQAMLGYSEEELQGMVFTEFTHPDDAKRDMELFEELMAGKRDHYQMEKRYIRKDGRLLWGRLTVSVVRDAPDERKFTIGMVEDVTRQRQTEEALKAYARQQAVVATLGQRALGSIELSRMMDEAVELVARALDVEYCKVLELLPDGEALLLRAGVGWKEGLVGQATVGTGIESKAGYTLLVNEPVIVEDVSTETRFSPPPLLRDHGVVSGVCVPIRDQGRPFGIFGVHTTRRRTFTEDEVHFLQAVANILATAVIRARMEEVRGRLLERVMSAQDEERRRIASELHDDTGQSLTALLVGLRMLEKARTLNEVRTQLSRLRRIGAQSLDDLGRLARGLHPRVLDDLGLAAALRRHAVEYARLYGLDAHVRAEGLSIARLPQPVEIGVYRIVQEALTNIAKHAGAKTVTVFLKRRPAEIEAVVTDDGRGFDVQLALRRAATSDSLGLHSMYERAALLGGSVTVESKRKKGTVVSVRIPLQDVEPPDRNR